MAMAPPEPRSWIRGYERDWLAPDALAGLSVWALVVPGAMAYASIAGLPRLPEAIAFPVDYLRSGLARGSLARARVDRSRRR